MALLFAVLAAAGLVGVDGIVGRAAPPPSAGSIWDQGVALLDLAAMRGVWEYLVGSVLIIAGVLLLALTATRPTGYALLYVGLVQLLTYAAADLSTPWFGRVRPAEALSGGHLWFAAGSSFPAVPTAFYAGLFFPLILLFPRLSPLWAIPPLFVAVAGIMGQDHYLSDVSASLALAAILAGLLAFIGEKARD